MGLTIHYTITPRQSSDRAEAPRFEHLEAEGQSVHVASIQKAINVISP